MSQKTNTSGVSSPAKVQRSPGEEEKLKKLYDDQQNNYKKGLELFEINEKINPIDPIPGEMSNFETDYEISEVFDGKSCVLGNNTFKSRVPSLSDMEGIRKLSIVKKCLIKAEVFRSLLRGIMGFRNKSDCFNIFCDELTEEQVKQLHQGLQILTDMDKNLVAFETTATNGKRVMRVMISKSPSDETRKWGWEPEFVHFVLRKKNIQFKKPVGQIAEILGVKTQDIGFAQLKEAGPICMQRISVPKVSVDKFMQLSKVKKSFQVGSFEWKKEPVKIGDLEGNRYRFALRGLNDNVDQVNEYEQCLEFLKQNGFINYFGNKRFLNKKGVPAYQIGKEILCRNYKEAINLIMTPSRDDPADVRQMKEKWALSNGNPTKTLDGSKGVKDEYEYKLVEQLKANPDDFIAALEKIPLNIRLGFIFAYQSYLWNIIASQRYKRKGLQLFPGDIVLVDSDKNIPSPEFYEDFSIPFTSRSEILPPLKRDSKQKPNYKDVIKFLTQEDIDSKKYTIQDLVLPLPGSEVNFPKNNDVGIWYIDLLAKDGLNKTRLSDKYCINGNEIVQNTNYFLHGTYRKFIVKPKNFKWEFKTYQKLSDNIFEKGDRLKSDKIQEDDKLALVLDFILPADSYINMALREIIDLEKSGFNDIYAASKKAIAEDKKERMEKMKIRDQEREKERLEREKLRAEQEKLKKPVVKPNTGPKGARTISKERNTREVSATNSSRRGRSKELLDGGVRKSRSTSRRMSQDRSFNRLGSREVSRVSDAKIQIRVDNFRPRSRSRSFGRDFNRADDRFSRQENTFRGIPICEFNTERPEDLDMDDSFNRDNRMMNDFRSNDQGIRIWDSPPRRDQRERDSRFGPPLDNRNLDSIPFDEMSRQQRQSVFDGRLAPRPLMRNPDPPEEGPGFRRQPSPFSRYPDDLRNFLEPPMKTQYDPEREFDRFEEEVNELNKECRSEQERRLREALDRDTNMRFGRDDNYRDRMNFDNSMNNRRRPHDEPLSPQIADKLRKLDEEALRLDLKRVTRLQNFDNAPNRDEMDPKPHVRDHQDDRRNSGGNSSMTGNRNLNRSRDMEEFERNFFNLSKDKVPFGGGPDRRMMDDPPFDNLGPKSRNEGNSRYFDDMPFGRDRDETIRSPSPDMRSNDRFNMPDRSNMNQRSNVGFNPQNDRFDQKSSNEFPTNKNFGSQPDNMKNFPDLRQNMSRNNQQGPSFGDRPGNQQGPSFGDRPGNQQGPPFGDRPGNQQGPPFGDRPGNQKQQPGPFPNMRNQFNNNNNGNNNNFGPNAQNPNQFQQRGMDVPWNNLMNPNRSNSPPPKSFQNQNQQNKPQWMNQDQGPNFGGPMPNQFGGNPMFDNRNNRFPLQGGPSGNQDFPNNNMNNQNLMMNLNNMFQNQGMGPGMGPGMGMGPNMMGGGGGGGPGMMGMNFNPRGPDNNNMQGNRMSNDRMNNANRQGQTIGPPGFNPRQQQNNRRSGKPNFN